MTTPTVFIGAAMAAPGYCQDCLRLPLTPMEAGHD